MLDETDTTFIRQVQALISQTFQENLLIRWNEHEHSSGPSTSTLYIDHDFHILRRTWAGSRTIYQYCDRVV